MAVRPFKVIADYLDPARKVTNKYYEAFLKTIGGSYTQYDERDRKAYIDKGYLYNPDVYAIVQQMATKQASIPWAVKMIKDKSAKTNLDRLMIQTKGIVTPQQTAKLKSLKTKAFQEKELDFPLDRPNPLQTWAEFKSLQKTFLKTTGNIFIYKVSLSEGMNAGKPKQLYILPSHLISIVLKHNADFNSDESPIDYYMLTEGSSFTKFEAENVIHIKYANPDYDEQGSHLYGLSPLKSALRNIQSSNEAIDNNNKTLSNSGAFGFLHSKGSTPLQPEQAMELKDRMKEMDADPSRLSKIAGVSAEIGFTRISLTTDELKPFDYLKFDQKTICNVLGWSDKLLNNDDGAKYDNVNVFRRQVITDNIMPDNAIIDEAMQNEFIRKFKGYENAVLESVYDDLPEMQQDIAEMVGWLKDLLDRGVINRDEFRDATNFEMLNTSEMKAYTVINDVIPLEEAILTDMNIDEGTNL